MNTVRATPRLTQRNGRWLLIAALLAVVACLGFRQYREHARQAELRQKWEAEQAEVAPLRKMVEMQLGKAVPVREWLVEFTRQSGIRAEFGQTDEPVGLHRFSRFNETYPISPQRIVWHDLPPLEAHEVLDALCDLHRSSWIFRSDGVAVLHEKVVAEPRHVRAYFLPGECNLIPDEIAELLRNYVATPEWEIVGGSRRCEVVPDGLAILQSERGHLQTAAFLRRLERLLTRQTQTGARLRAPSDARFEPVWLDGDQDCLETIQKVLQRPVSIQANNLPWPDFVAELARQVHYPLVLQPQDTRQELHWGRVTCQLQGVPLRAALQAAGKVQLAAFRPIAGGRALAVVTNEQAEAGDSALTFAYPVADLFEPGGSAQDQWMLAQAVESMISTPGWNSGGSTEPLTKHGLLLVRDSLAGHARVGEFLAAARLVRSGQVRSQVAQAADTTSEQKRSDLAAKLSGPRELHYAAITLNGLLNDIRSQNGVSLPQFEWLASRTRDAIWCHFPAAPLRENLQLLLTALNYELYLLDHVDDPLAPLSAEYFDSSQPMTIEICDLRPWLSGPKATSTSHFLELVNSRDGWYSRGRTIRHPAPAVQGNIDCLFQDLLVVKSTPRLALRTKDLLQLLEEHERSGQRVWQGKQLTPELLAKPLPLRLADDPVEIWQRELDRRMAALQPRMEQLVSVDYRDLNLGEALLKLARDHHIPLLVYAFHRRFDPWSAKITFTAQDKPLGEVLQSLLGDPADVTWRIQSGCVIVLAAKGESRREQGQLYSIADLVHPRGPLSPEQVRLTLQYAVAPPAPHAPPPVSGPADELFYIQLPFDNLLWLLTERLDQRQAFETALQELRSGELKTLTEQQTLDAMLDSRPNMPGFQMRRAPVPAPGLDPFGF